MFDPENLSVFILAGGEGTRLKARSADMPKPLVKLQGKPYLLHQLEFCSAWGLNDFHILAGFKADQIENFVKTVNLEANITVISEDTKLGTGGALCSGLTNARENVLVLYGDTFFSIDFDDFITSYEGNRGTEKFLGSILIHPNSHPFDSDLVVADRSGFISQIIGYPRPEEQLHRNLVNAAMYLFDRDVLRQFMSQNILGSPFDIAKDLLPACLSSGFNIGYFKNSGFIRDLGTPERLDEIDSAFCSGKISNLMYGKNKTAVILDRDGCINKEVGRITNSSQLSIIPGSAEGIRRFNENFIQVFCATNQPVVARGDVSDADLNLIHSQLDNLLSQSGAYLNELVYCPHHPDAGFEGEVRELKFKCNCRKPNIGLLQVLHEKYQFNANKSWYIGDTRSDIKAGKDFGLKTVLVRTGYGGEDFRVFVDPDFVFKDLNEASQFICNDYHKIWNFIVSILPIIIDKKYIFIGGLSRSGKSTFSSVLKHVLSSIGQGSEIISLDSFLLPSTTRETSTSIFDRYDLQSLNDFFFRLAAGGFPHYFCKKSYNKDGEVVYKTPVVLTNQDIVIVEGCPVGVLGSQRPKNSVDIFVDVDENLRRDRFIEKYRHRGFDICSIEELYANRQSDEDFYINQWKTDADFVYRIN